MLYRYQAGSGGRWKSTNNDIVERAGTGEVVRVRFTPTSAVATPEAMADLVTHDHAHDARPWLDYFWGVLIRAYGEFEERVATLQGSKADQIRAAVARRVGAFGIADIERDAPGVSRDMVRHVLRQMRTEGLVGVEGLGRGAKWRAAPRPEH